MTATDYALPCCYNVITTTREGSRILEGEGHKEIFLTAFMNEWPAEGWVWFTTLSSLHDKHKFSNKMAAGGQK